MSVFQSTTELSWPLALKTSAGREPPFIMTIGEAASFAQDEIRLGLEDDALWRQCFARLAAAYDSPSNQVLLTEATRATQLALYGNCLLEDEGRGPARPRPHAVDEPSNSSALQDRAPQARAPVLVLAPP
jgi:hypothetical protein